MVDIIDVGFAVDSDPLRKANQEFDNFTQGAKKAKGSSDQFTQSNQASAKSLGAVKVALASVAAALSVREIIRYADAWKGVSNQLNAITGDTQKTIRVQNELLALANRTRTGFEGVAALYGRLALTSTELGASQEQLIKFTQGIGQALAIQGTTATEAQGALLQLSQAIGGGIVRAEEFNSLLEGGIVILKTVAENMGATGISIAELRNRVVDGKITSEEFFNAFLRGTSDLQEQFDQTSATIGQGFTVLGNNVTGFIGKLDAATGTSSAFADILIAVGNNLEPLLAGLGTAGLLLILPQVTTAVKALNVAMLVNPFGLAVAAIGLAVAAMVKYRDETVQIGDMTIRVGSVMNAVWTTISESIGVAINNLTSLGSALYALGTGQFSDAKNILVDAVENMAQGAQNVGEAWKEVFTGGDGLPGVLEETAAATEEVIEPIKQLHLAMDEIIVTTRENEETLLSAADAQKILNDFIETGLTDQQQYERQVAEVERALSIMRSNGLEPTVEQLRLLNQALQEADPAYQAMKEAAEDAAADMEKTWDRAAENMQRSFADAFEQMLRGSLSGFKDFAKSMLDIFLSTISNIAAANLFSGLFGGGIGIGAAGAVPGAVPGAGPGLFSIGSAGIGAANFFNSGGFAGLGTTFNSSIFGNFATSGLGQTLGLSYGLPAGVSGPIALSPSGEFFNNITSPAALAGGFVGSGLSSLLFTPRQGPGNEIGGLIGGAAGTLIPGIGNFLGAAIGSFIGSAIGGLFGSKPSSKLQGSFLDIVTGEVDTFGFEGKKFSQQNRDIADKFTSSVSQFIDGLREVTGGTISSLGGGTRFGIEVSNREGITVSFGDQISRTFQTVEAAWDFTTETIVGGLTGISDDVVTAIDNITFSADNMEAAFRDLQFASDFQANLEALRSGSVDLQDAISAQAAMEVQAYVAQIRDFKDTTERLGLDTVAAAEATRIFVENLVGIREAVGPQTPIQQALAMLEGRFSAIGPLLEEVGIGAEQATVLLQQAVERLGNEVIASMQSRLNEISGRGFLNEIGAAIAQREFDIQDITDLGLESSLPQQIFEATIGSIIRGIATGPEAATNLRNIIDEFSDFPAITAAANAALIELSDGMEDMTTGSLATLIDLEKELYEARQREAQSIEGQIIALEDVRTAIQASINAARINPNLSPFGPEGRLREAQSQYDAILAAASGGDIEAAAQLPAARDALLQAARDQFASTTEFSRIFFETENELKSISITTEREIDIQRAQLSTLNAILVAVSSGPRSIADIENDIGTATGQVMADLSQQLTDLMDFTQNVLPAGVPEGVNVHERLLNTRQFQQFSRNRDEALNAITDTDYLINLLGRVEGFSTAGGYLDTANAIRGRLSQLGIDQFADGGLTSGGLSLVGEYGPEVVRFPGGTRISPMNSISSSGNELQQVSIAVSRDGFNALIGEMQEMKAEIVRLRRETRQKAMNAA